MTKIKFFGFQGTINWVDWHCTGIRMWKKQSGPPSIDDKTLGIMDICKTPEYVGL